MSGRWHRLRQKTLAAAALAALMLAGAGAARAQDGGDTRPIGGFAAESGLGSQIEILVSPSAPMPDHLVEASVLEAAVTAGTLPPIVERLPAKPAVDDFIGPDLQPGRQGGTWTMLVGRPKDVRMGLVYGYARLMRYAQDLSFEADILDRVEIQDGRTFTMRLRPGHRWSDGEPFTADDFRYFWEDVVNNPKLYPAGPPRELLVDGEPPRFTVINDTTVRYSWSKPNPRLLPAIAGPLPLTLYRPAHYLRQFHERYADPETLLRMVNDRKQSSWAALHNRMDTATDFSNPAYPTLQPWRLVTAPPSIRFVAERNPYFHRIDINGRQLPYLDSLAIDVVDGKLISARTGTGDALLQARGLDFTDYTFLKAGAARSDYKVNLWRTGRGAHLALYPNLNARDDGWRSLFRDARFRRALSLGVDRHEIDAVLYYGLTIGGANTVLKESPLSRPAYRRAWAAHDVAQANKLLDEMGLDRRNDRGIRLMPDGRPLEMVVETAGESTEQMDILELVHDQWLDLGIKIYARPMQRDLFRNRIFAGDTLMSVWFGLEAGLATAETDPWELAPISQQSLQWPKWGQYYETNGKSGEAPDIPSAELLLSLYKDWTVASSSAARARIWREMLAINADQVYSISLVAGVLQPVVMNARLRNVPERGLFNWDPGSHFGLYRPERFWLDN